MREFLEVTDVGEFLKLADGRDIVIRLDPFLLIFHYGLIFYINLARLGDEERRTLINRLRPKIIYVRSISAERGIAEFLRKWDSSRRKV
jgi:hypothetical protein